MRALGLMSGTSLDGTDVALVSIEPRARSYAISLEKFGTVPFEPSLRERLIASLPPHVASAAALAALDRELGRVFAAAARSVVAGASIDYVASHGLTAFHRGERGETMQIGDPYALRDEFEATVVFDFRRADCAAGGHGAPLVPYVDAMLLASRDDDVVALNLGGIANVTVLRRGTGPARAIAWDTGPANMLLDAFVAMRTDGVQCCDRDGAFASVGHANEGIVRMLIEREPYFAQPPPKSTGRERFGAQFLTEHGDLLAALSLEDGCATLAAFSAEAIARSLRAHGPRGGRIVASGGGTANPALVHEIRERVRPIGFSYGRSDARGIDPDAKEALAFAVLGYETLRGRPSSVPAATGARHATVLGAIVPHDLAALIAKMHDEAAANCTA